MKPHVLRSPFLKFVYPICVMKLYWYIVTLWKNREKEKIKDASLLAKMEALDKRFFSTSTCFHFYVEVDCHIKYLFNNLKIRFLFTCTFRG